VDGVCLTVTLRTAEGFAVDAVAETLHRTTLGELRPGDPVNLERALRVGDRLGGHLVQGHVDGTAPVLEVARRGGDVRLAVGLPEALRPYVAFKGSIALSGVSLTVASVEGEPSRGAHPRDPRPHHPGPGRPRVPAERGGRPAGAVP
jgi:riboflavin synthase alpha subunit